MQTATSFNVLHRLDMMARQMNMRYDATFTEAAWAEFEEDFAVRRDANLVLAVDLDPRIRSRSDELWNEVKLS